MNILLGLLSFLTFNMEPITVSSTESNIYIGENYLIIIKTNNCEEKVEKILSFVTYDNNNIFSPK